VLLQILTIELGIKELGSLKQTKTMYHAIEEHLLEFQQNREILFCVFHLPYEHLPHLPSDLC